VVATCLTVDDGPTGVLATIGVTGLPYLYVRGYMRAPIVRVTGGHDIAPQVYWPPL
jgi:hypothetical protein